MTDRQILLDMFARRNIKLDTEYTDDEAIFIDSWAGYTAISFDPDGNLLAVEAYGD